MPDRYVRAAILTSEPVNQLSWAAEVFYRRLMSVVDDYGRYDARPIILRTALYPLKIDRVSDSDIGKWMTECVEAGLVRGYTVDGKQYLQVVKFGQRIRSASRFPAPPGESDDPLTSADICQQVTADDSNCRPNANSNSNAHSRIKPPVSPKTEDPPAKPAKAGRSGRQGSKRGFNSGDLDNTAAVLGYLRDTSGETGLNPEDYHTQLRALGCAERAIEHGIPGKEAGLFVSLIKAKDWEKISDEQADRAKRRLRKLAPPTPPPELQAVLAAIGGDHDGD